jgi:hypothetical protein
MENEFDFDLEDRQNFKINPEVWLHTLLAITGDKEKKAAMVRQITRKTGYSPDQVDLILTTTIGILIDQTRAN